MVNTVYKLGCRRPREEALAVQLLGQAHNYRDDLRRIYNANKRDVRALSIAKKAGDDTAHVMTFLRDRLNERVRAARQPQARGHLVDNGTYWLVEDAVKQAAAASGLDPIASQPWDGTGRIGAAIGAKQHFPADEWEHSRVELTEPNAKGHAELTILVGRLADRRSITWPIKLDRPFPPGAIVKQVAVRRSRTGHRFRWDAIVTMEVAERRRAPRSRGRAPQCADDKAVGVVGIDIGWRREGKAGLRVATHDAADGPGALHIDTLEAFQYTDAVRSIRDVNFDAAKGYAAASGLPGSSHAALWRDKERMCRLAERTNDLGPVWWRYRDNHLEDIECGVRARAIRRRLDVYRKFADTLAKRYQIVALEDMSMSDWVGQSETHERERVRAAASLSLLQGVLAERFGPDRVDWVPSMYTSRTCAHCGAVRGETVGPAAQWVCDACGETHHQDENAARVIRKACESWLEAKKPLRARTKKPKRRPGRPSADGIATGDPIRMVVTTTREPTANAAE